LINEVLDLEKIESGRMEWTIEAVDLAGAIHECVAATDQLFRERGIRVELELPRELPRVRADHDRLIQVLTNLVSNAVKFSPPDTGRVWIRAQQYGDAVQVDVEDNGPGIDPENHGMIFEKFGQVGSLATGKPEGTGLGLPISRSILEHLGGRIWVRSRPGEGATFSFTLPVDPRAEGRGKREEAGPPEQSGFQQVGSRDEVDPPLR
jgi:signal transduction histidine kinase